MISKFFRIIFLLAIMHCNWASAQSATVDAEGILDKALDQLLKPAHAIYFEGVADQLKNPLDIFTLPVYQIHRGGYLFTEDDKFEFSIGTMKGLCNGLVYTIINESTKQMILDSLVTKDFDGNPLTDEGMIKGLENIASIKSIQYLGEESVNKKLCYKIKAIADKENVYSLYYIDKKSNRLILFSDYDEETNFTSYWIKSITDAPKNHDYTLRLPSKETDKLFGYEAYDMRFTYNKIHQKIK